MSVSIDLIKELRSKTGAGMADCKKALEDAAGDIEKAIELLRKKGAALASKRADKSTNEGAVKSKISSDRTRGSIVEINCETDFVSKGEDFQNFADEVAQAALELGKENVEELVKTKMSDLTLQEKLGSLMAKVGEKIEIKRAKVINVENGFVGDYNHFGSKLGSIVGVKGEYNDKSAEIANKIAMQVVAMNPLAIKREDVSQEITEKEKDIYISQAKNEDKPENILDKIVENKIEKFYQDNVLLEQEYIQDSKMTVGDLLKHYEKESGKPFELVEIVRYQLG